MNYFTSSTLFATTTKKKIPTNIVHKCIPTASYIKYRNNFSLKEWELLTLQEIEKQALSTSVSGEGKL